MGILKSHINLICDLEKQYSFFKNSKVISISQQAVYSDLNEVTKILKKNGLKLKKLNKGFDTKNKIKDWYNTKLDKNINANTLFHLLGAKEILTSDVSKYENPDVVIDLNKKINKKFINKFDLVFDIGTLEHVFDTPTCLENYLKMTKTNGYIFIAVPCSNMIDHSFYMFSPTLFFDFFESNGCKIVSSYLRISSPYVYNQKSIFYKYLKQGPEIPLLREESVEFIVLIKKTDIVKKIIKPTQYVYRKDPSWNLKTKNINKNHIYKNPIKSFISYILKSKFMPFFIHKYFYKYIRGKNIKKYYL